jgi:hypothetical protein
MVEIFGPVIRRVRQVRALAFAKICAAILSGYTANVEIAFEMLEIRIPAVHEARVIPEPAKPAPMPRRVTSISSDDICGPRRVRCFYFV